MLVMAGNVLAKSEGLAFDGDDCTGDHTGTLDFGDAFCTVIPGGPWNSLEFFTGTYSALFRVMMTYFDTVLLDGETQCFHTYTGDDCSEGLFDEFIFPGSGCFTNLNGELHSIQKIDC